MCETYTQPYRRTLTDNQIHDIALAITIKKMGGETWDNDTEYNDWYKEYCKSYSHIYKLDHKYDPQSTFEL